MTAPNPATLWGRTIVEELARSGLEAIAFAPGSRSTPLVVAAAEHPELRTYSHLDERSCAFFALGRARRTGAPTAIVCTSGTAATNFHPAVVEASQARVPMIVLTADRPPELTDSGANQTIDQEKLYGDAVRWYRDLPEPDADPRTVRSLRTATCRAVAEATNDPRGPVHLNVRVRKPLEPTPKEGSVPPDFEDRHPLAAHGRGDDPYVRTTSGRPAPDSDDVDRIADALSAADSGVIVAGPADPPPDRGDATARLGAATGFPVLADPLSSVRWGVDRDDAVICGGYDGYLEAMEGFDPDVAVRFGASPTSKVLRHALREADARQFVVDPAGAWREATFTATDLVVASPGQFASAVSDRVAGADEGDGPPGGEEETRTREFAGRFRRLETTYWETVESARASETFEGQVLATVVEDAPDPATVFVSNSMPVRDLDRFGRPREADLTVLGNRGASGIDGIVSTALGAGSATDDPLVLVTGDLAYYHDANGLAAIARCGVDATIVVVDNDGGGIFHMLPIEDFDPPFTEAFETPHGIEFAATGDMYGLEYRSVSTEEFDEVYRETVGAPGTTVLAVEFDAERSHRTREEIERRVAATIADRR